MFSIIQNVDESIKAFMKIFCEEKIEIFDFSYSIAIQAFRRGALKISDLFIELTKMIP